VERGEQRALPDCQRNRRSGHRSAHSGALRRQCAVHRPGTTAISLIAASPIVEGEVWISRWAFRAVRATDRGDADYINCPMDRGNMRPSRRPAWQRSRAELKDFETESATFFEGCLPIEELAAAATTPCATGRVKPIGLWDPRCDRLRSRGCAGPGGLRGGASCARKDRGRPLWKSGGLQDHLKWAEQKRVFRLILAWRKRHVCCASA